MHEVYAYGVIAPSTLYLLADPFPAAEGYAEIAEAHASVGGEAAAGAYVLARLGVGVKLAGNRLGDDEAAGRTVEILESAGVDCSSVHRDPSTPPVVEAVFSAGDGRTIMGTFGRLLSDASWEDPSEADIRSSRAVALDPFFGDASLQAARWCREASVPYVTVDAGHESEIAADAAVLVLSAEFAERTFGSVAPEQVMAAYLARCRGLVILTRGGNRLWFGRQGEHPRQFEPMAVETRDTTGAGDAFRAGIVYGLLMGYGDRQMVRTASAIAAVVCTGAPGVLQAPTDQELQAFMAEHA